MELIEDSNAFRQGVRDWEDSMVAECPARLTAQLCCLCRVLLAREEVLYRRAPPPRIKARRILGPRGGSHRFVTPNACRHRPQRGVSPVRYSRAAVQAKHYSSAQAAVVRRSRASFRSLIPFLRVSFHFPSLGRQTGLFLLRRR